MTKEEEERFIRLETKLAYQEKLLMDLNDVVLGHDRLNDRLAHRVQELERVLRDQAGEPIGHEAPPHY